jgi:hypothetical protein
MLSNQLKKANKSEQATPRKPSDSIFARHRRACPMTFSKEMKTPLILLTTLVLGLQSSLFAENSLMQVYQPTSLLGTEMDGDPLGTGESMAATIVSRPVLIGGAFPESPVHAISLPHRIAGAGESFPSESNLIVMVGGRVHAEHGEKEHRIIADFSKAKVPENLGLTLVQVMKMTAVCLQRTLGTQHEKPILITWLAPDGVSLVNGVSPRFLNTVKFFRILCSFLSRRIR